MADDDLLRLYHSGVGEAPDADLDCKVLTAARAHHARRRYLPQLLAASVMVALLSMLPQKPVATHSSPPDSKTFGMYEGRVAALLSDPEAMRQVTVRQMPGGAD